MNANRLALGHRAESVRVALASTVHEFAADTANRVVIVFLEGASTVARLHWQVASICENVFQHF